MYDKEYLTLINNTIKEHKEKYAALVYAPKIQEDVPIKEIKTFLNVDNVDETEIHFTINDISFLELLLMEIRTVTMSYAKKIKKRNDEREDRLIKDIQYLEKAQYIWDTTDILQDKKIELQNHREQKLKGHMIRSRVQWIIEGEKPTNFFCGLENKNYIDKTIKKLVDIDQNIITDQKKYY